MSPRLVLCLSLLLFAGLPPASATTFVVDGNHVAADDSGPGSPDRPFRTIGRAAGRAGPGDVVTVRPGLYRETIRLPRSGEAGAPIRFEADPAGPVVVTGADPLAGFRRLPGPEPIFVAPWPHRFTIGHDAGGGSLEHHPESEPVWGRAEQVIAGGQLLLPVRDLEALRAAWRARDAALAPPVPNLGGPFGGVFAVDTRNRTLSLWLADGADPATRELEAATRPHLVAPATDLPGGVAHVAFRGFTFRYAANFPQRAAVDLSGSGNLLEGCVVERTNGVGLTVDGTLRDCVVRGNGHVGGSAEGAGFVNERVLWEGNSWKPIDRRWEAGGVKVTRDGPGLFRGCVFRRNGGPGLWFDLDAHDIRVERSRFEENEGSGLFIEISRDVTVADSDFSGNAAGAIGRPKEIEWGSAGIMIAESLRARILGNRLVANRDGISFREQGPRPVESQDGRVIAYRNGGHEVRGNRVSDSRGYQLAFWWDNAFFGPHPSAKPAPGEAAFDPAAQDLTIAGNRFEAGSGTGRFLYGAPWRPRSRRFETLAAFARETGFESPTGAVARPVGPGR